MFRVVVSQPMNGATISLQTSSITPPGDREADSNRPEISSVGKGYGYVSRLARTLPGRLPCTYRTQDTDGNRLQRATR